MGSASLPPRLKTEKPIAGFYEVKKEYSLRG
jgi:hypothetical protein